MSRQRGTIPIAEGVRWGEGMHWQEKSALWVRPGTSDEIVWQEVQAYRALGSVKGKHVLDGGANIGAYARMAGEEGAQAIVCVEPDPANVKMLRRNTSMYTNVRIIEAALAPKNGECQLYLNSFSGQSAQTVVPTRGREFITVPTVAWMELLRSEQPNVVKLDIESGEYDLNFSDWPVSVTGLILELHLNRAGERDFGAPRVVKEIAAMGFTTVREPNIGLKNWHTIGIWQR